MSFYRIYRPHVIEEIDNIRVREILLSLLQKEKKQLPHAYLFIGSRGTGKTTAARLVAKLFTCQKLSKSTGPCGVCESCVSIANGNHMDVLEIDAASNRGIDEIRTLRDGIALTPVSGDYKVYIIDEVHMLTTEAFNALLKTLEEPPLHAIFILATTDPQKLPKTIQSRCMVVSFSQATGEELMHALTRIITREKMDIDEDSLRLLSTAADGSFRDAVKLLEQVSFGKGKITRDKAAGLLSITPESSVSEILGALQQRNVKEAIGGIQNLVSIGGDIKMFVVEILRNLEQKLLMTVDGTYTGEFLQEDIRDLIHRLTVAYGEIKISSIPQLPLELAVVEYCDQKKDTGNVIHRLDEVKQENVRPVKIEGKALSENLKPVDVTQPEIEGMLSLEHLVECWKDVIEECKPLNHSVAGVLRSARPKSVNHGIVTIEAFYSFHQEKLSEVKAKEMLTGVFKKLFGEKVKVEVVLGKK